MHFILNYLLTFYRHKLNINFIINFTVISKFIFDFFNIFNFSFFILFYNI